MFRSGRPLPRSISKVTRILNPICCWMRCPVPVLKRVRCSAGRRLSVSSSRFCVPTSARAATTRASRPPLMSFPATGWRNEDFNDEELLDLFELRTSTWWSSITNADKYARERLSGDLESLRSFYLDRGYLDFNVESSQVSISPDKKQVFIAIALNEGPQYTVSEVRLRGELIVDEDELRDLIPIEEGDVFSRSTATAVSERLSRRLGREGYAFANVNAVPEPGDDNTAAVTFFVEPGKRAYVRRVNFSGNVSTRDEVMRQEMTQMEGGVASTDRIEFSKTRLERLGFFQTVDVDTVPVPGTDDMVDVNY
ncbi:unnamed protein product, partial [Ectocarpus sp. 12 AP-2014]